MFRFPSYVKRVTSYFRTPSRPDHHGVDFAEKGTHPIMAVADGVVSRSYMSTSYGECVMIEHNIAGQVWESVYAHMRKNSRNVKTGDRVKEGQTIGYMGDTGRSTGQHLHFELHKGRWNVNKTYAVDPLKYLGVVQTEKFVSLVDYLKSKHLPSDFISRRNLATKYGIRNYTGTADQNVKLLACLQGN